MDTTQTYVKAFNRGYFLKQHDEKLFKLFAQSLQANSSVQEGFVAGGKEYEKEQKQDKRRERLQKLNRSKDVPERGRER